MVLLALLKVGRVGLSPVSVVPTCTPLASKTSQECVNAGFVAATVATVGVKGSHPALLVSVQDGSGSSYVVMVAVAVALLHP